MKVSPANVLLALTLAIICLIGIVVVRTRSEAASTLPPRKVQSLRIQASAALPSPSLPATPSHIIPPTQTLVPAIATKPDQYRTWMEEARLQYPYDESLDTMWSVMLCESSGNPDVVADIYYGLFQYSPTTWGGDWNPYRDQSILDPHAQIFATAKAWHEGNQGWWGCYPS